MIKSWLRDWLLGEQITYLLNELSKTRMEVVELTMRVAALEKEEATPKREARPPQPVRTGRRLNWRAEQLRLEREAREAIVRSAEEQVNKIEAHWRGKNGRTN